ncbi:portal protein, partial [Plastoroseomonas hellenica]|uniref:portal protein n=1 Tax=Plastoroseomonas hellenica TaxID=2687306 RepID=UPI001BACAA04
AAAPDAAALEAAGPEPLTPENIRALVRGGYADAADAIDSHQAPERQRAQDYYDGLIHDRQERREQAEDLRGRSTVVAREVADIVHQMLPGLIRIFTSGERVVEFVPHGPEDEAMAEQMTDYVGYCINADGNSWFATLHDAVHDALLKKTGIVKWWWDEAVRVEELDYTGLDPLTEARLLADPAIEVLERVETETTVKGSAPYPAAAALGAMVPAAAGAPGGMAGNPPVAGAPPPLPAMGMLGLPDPLSIAIDLRVRRTVRRGVLRLMAVPPEEFVIARDARDVEGASYCAHRSLERISDLVARGAGDVETLARHATAEADFALNDEATQRDPARALPFDQSSIDRSAWRVLHIEHFIRCDADGDGIAELHRVCTVGDDCELVLSDEVVPEVPMALGSPVRQPHRVIGSSIADQTLDLQDLKTGILRSVMDSLAEALDPKMAVVEGQVNLDDVANNERGAIIRMKTPGAVQMLNLPFVGAEAMGVLAYVDEVKAQRTGITRASRGLDPEALQSATKVAVQNTIEASQERVEMIARTLAETLVKQVFRGVLRALVRHQDRPRMVRLRGRWVEIDPRVWDAEMDVSVNVALGRGPDSQRMAFLMMVLQQQQQILTTIGPDNPLVTIRQLRATLAEIVRLGGYKDANRFFLDPGAADDMAFRAKAQQARGQGAAPDPGAALAQAQIQNGRMEAEARIATSRLDAQVKLEAQRLEAWKAAREDDRERDRAEADILLRAYEMQLKHGQPVDLAAILALLERERLPPPAMAAAPPTQPQQPVPPSQPGAAP